MYKRTTYLSVLIILCLFLSCQKKADTSSNQTFSLSYTDTLTIGINCDATFAPSLDFSGPSATLSVSGLPANVSVSPSSLPLTTGSLTPQFVFSCNNATPGIYPLQLNITNASTGTKTYFLYLKVEPLSTVAPQLAGIYTNFACSSEGTSEIVATGNSSDSVYITNIDAKEDGLNVYAILNQACSTENNVSISVPLQTVNGITIHGSGNAFQDGEEWLIDIADTITSTSGTTICNMELE